MNTSLNTRALALADVLAADPEGFGVAVSILSNGARLIDCGANAPGGFDAGRIFAEICMGGLGTVSFTEMSVDGLSLPAVLARTDHPETACLASQYAGWAVQREKYFAMGSGPARGLVRAEPLFDELQHKEQADCAVLCLETRQMPDADIAAYIAQRAGVPADRLTLLAAPTASMAGGIQIAARIVETALHKLHALKFHMADVLHGAGIAPLPPIAKSDPRAIGRTNDAILYGGRAHLTVRGDDAQIEALAARVPSSTSANYGEPFYDVLKAAGFDFYKIDPMLFSPAEIALTNVTSGRTFRAGALNGEVLRQSFQ